MSDRLREALEWLESGPNEASIPNVRTLAAAARRWLALTETGPDYKAAKRAYDDAPVPIRSEDFVRRIVDAALADYLTGRP